MLTKSRISLLAALAAVLSTGCEKAMHDMYDQRKYGPLEPSDLFPEGVSIRRDKDEGGAGGSVLSERSKF
jgi:hypothetical protein